ncbi:MAG TPA: alpha-2-macroglobulin family protein, partial [Thiolinea sp.]|nr:alpha-2-macroglobulin family protein [Thiolinea sp.]
LQHFNLPEDAPEGIWRAELRLDDESKLSGVLEFQVERYQAAIKQLKLSVGKALITKDDKQIVSLQGSYEYGGATAGQRVVATRNLQIASQPLGEAFKAYSFGLPEDAEQLEAVKLPELSLDPQGNGFLEFPALASAIQSPLMTTIRASLLELGGRPTTSELQQAYWPAQHLIGLKPLFEKANVAANSEARFDIIRVDPVGNLLAAQHLTATLFSESYDYYWEYAADQGWQQKGIRNQYPVSQQILDIPAGQHGQLALLVSEGKYRLEVEDADTKLKAAYAFTAGWENTATSPAEPNSLELKLDKAMYKTGETAKLAVNLPMSSEALVTVEGGQLLWSKQLSLAAGDSVIDIPLEAAWLRHDLYVAVNALEVDPNQQQKTIRRRFGILPLVLDRSERQLDLSIEAPETITAEQDLKIVVRANHLNSEDALVTVAAIDVQLAEQTVQPRPDPYSFYFSSHAYEARLYDDYNRIIADAEIPTLIKAFLPEAPTSNPLPPQLSSHLTTLVSDPVKFDAEGKAEINFKLPPFVGNLYLQATAITANQFGSVSKELQVIAPIQVNLKAPSFLATGDQGFLRLELKNVSELDQALQLKINSNNAIDGIALDKTLNLSKGQNELLQLPIKTLSSLGLGQINLEITGKDFQLKRQLNIPIRPAYAPVITYEQHELLGLGKSTELSNQANRYLANTAETCLSIANTPSLPVATMVRNLMHYPYESLEQTVSSTYPYLFLDEAAAQKWDLPPISLAQRTQRVQE